ncbi:hypothetical protein RCK60_23380, partial [Salmonella enterica subsp. enterica serovar Enteritidis]
YTHSLPNSGPAQFLNHRGSKIIAPTWLQRAAPGPNGPVSALATIQVVITAAFVILVRRLLGVKIYG